MSRSVAITGVGVVSALGLDRPQFEQSLRDGRGGIRPLEGFPPDLLRMEYGARLEGFDGAQRMGSDAAAVDPFVQYLVVAAREAVELAGLDLSGELASRTAIVSGSSGGGLETFDDSYRRLYGEGKTRLHPLTIPRIMANAGASRLSIDLGVTGPAFTISTACASATHAIGQAFWMVRSGMVEAAICGGSEAPFSLGNLKAWEAMRAVAPEPCRPFSKDRRGMTLGEGAGVLVLESMERAVERGASILGEITGFGMSSDAHHLTQPSAEGAATAIRSALADAALDPGRVDYVNAHGTGTRANDATEAEALRQVFGERTAEIFVSSTKSSHGHALGAAGALEAAATIFTLREQIVPPTLGFSEPDPECDLRVVTAALKIAEDRPLEVALSNSFAFGGLNAVLVFRRSSIRS